MTIRPRRSVLYMPGSNARAIEKARTLPADAIILDLEDSVAPDAKDRARARRSTAVQRGRLRRARGLRPRQRSRYAMVARRSRCGLRRRARRHPGAENLAAPAQLEHIGQRLIDIGADHRIRVWAMLETPFAMLNVREIAAAALDFETRLTGFVLGTNDLAKETRCAHRPRPRADAAWLSLCVAAARAYGRRSSSTVSTTTSAMRTALRANARRRAISASTARR